jgi:hypothetical protein
MDVPVIDPTPWYSSGYLKLAILVLLGIFIYIRVLPHIYYMLDMIQSIRQLMNMTTALTDTDKKMDKLVVNKSSKPAPKPDESKHQSESQSKANGYCFIGEWKGVRSCVRVDQSPCATQVYSTEELCVNPTLR